MTRVLDRIIVDGRPALIIGGAVPAPIALKINANRDTFQPSRYSHGHGGWHVQFLDTGEVDTVYRHEWVRRVN